MQNQHIGWAYARLTSGEKVRRAGWNNKGMYLVYMPTSPDAQIHPKSPYGMAGLERVTIDAHIDMFTARGTMQPGWVCLQADFLATDWEDVDADA